jgi:REP element-mobilizing transposase RayT
MPRTARLDIHGLLYHVIVRGIERRPIFHDDRDRTFFVERFAALLQETQTDCLAWSLLQNHIHMLLRPRSASLSTFMRRLLTSYAVTFNLRHKRCGHLFQNRYKSLLCDEESYLLELVRYVHLNPLRAGLAATMKDLSTYPWCGHAVVMGNRSLTGQNTEEVLERFGKTLKSARAHYETFVSEGITTDAPEPEQAKGLRRWLAGQIGQGDDLAADERVLGGENFWQEMHLEAEAEHPTAMPLPVLLKRVATAFDVTPEQLLRRTRVFGVADARAAFCYLAAHAGGHSGAEIARVLRMSRSGVYIAIGRGEVLLKNRMDLLKILPS